MSLWPDRNETNHYFCGYSQYCRNNECPQPHMRRFFVNLSVALIEIKLSGFFSENQFRDCIPKPVPRAIITSDKGVEGVTARLEFHRY